MRWVKRTAIGLAVVLGLAVAAVTFLPADRLARMAAERIEAETGRTLVIDGPVRATLWPRPGVVAEGVRIANADWSTQGPMLVAERLSLALSPGALLRGALRLSEARLDGAALVLERSADGIGNWELASGGPPAARPDTADAPAGLPLDRLILTGAELSWIDHASERTLALRAVDLDLTLDEAAAVLDASALAGARAVRIAGRIAAPRSFLAGEVEAVSLSVASGGTALTLDGRSDLDPLSFDGTVDARSEDRFALLSALGLAVPDPPEGFGRDRVALTAAATLAADGGLYLRGLDAALDGNRLSGALDVVPGPERPRLTATLDLPSLDLDAISREGRGGESALVTETGWGREPLDASALHAVDAEVTLSVGPVAMGAVRLDGGDARLTIDAGRAVLTLDALRGYGGRVTGDLVANARGGLSARADLTLDAMRLGPLLDGFTGYDWLTGTGAGRIDLLAVGETAEDLVRSLRGEVTLDVAEGAVAGIDLDEMIRARDPRALGDGRTTVLEAAAFRAVVEAGVARIDGSRIDTPLLDLSAEGVADLGARTLDVSVAPETSGTPLHVRVTGRWSDPRIRPDIDRFAREAAAAERRRLEARAREEAARLAEEARVRLARELGVDPGALTGSEGIEDAVRGRIEDELIDLLRGE